LDPDFGARTKAVAGAEPEKAVAELREQGHFTVDAAREPATVRGEHVQILEKPRSGRQVSSDGPYGTALDLETDHGLHLEGLARITRLLNELRNVKGWNSASASR
jgi:hypothetical protein